MILKSNDWFKSHGDVKCWIPNGRILPNGGGLQGIDKAGHAGTTS